MIQYLAVAQRPIKKFKSCKLTQIPCGQNSQADALANLGSALETRSQMNIPLLVLQWPATLEEPPSEEVSSVEESETWMTPLIWYLEADTLPEDSSEARKIKKQAARYCISQEKLYQRSLSGPYLRKWVKELHEVLWAYRITLKTTTGETPYSLVYGSEAIVPTEVRVRTTVSGSTSQEENNELLALSLDLLDEKREAGDLRSWPTLIKVA
ncbi:PREDICTED: uncharacterized protein LOC106308522 [Brassica oleracea var. oleracea]|uniref:uncharacterized protein LOC106308522 n=1 Tax=Brassica oleracea var. oleracea TaxID=109376 RepID=UPI0006A7260C|nr:PREDICTED: uncharacterized protein LOC106308522 [Brassica oleracea var. oleracea]